MFIELLLGGLRFELVVLKTADFAGQIGRQHVKLHRLAGRAVFGQLGVPAVPIGRISVAQVLQPFPALLAELAEKVPEALDLLPVAVLETLLHQAAQGGHRVAVVHEIIRDLAHQIKGVEIKTLLASIPAGVAKALTDHDLSLTASLVRHRIATLSGI